MMATQRESKLVFIFAMLLIILASCSDADKTLVNEDLTEDSFREIKAGMTEKEVKTLLGEPDRVIEDEEEVQRVYRQDKESTDIWADEDPDIYSKFYGSEKKMEEYYNLRMERKEDIICFGYNYQYKKDMEEEWHIYFIDEKVVYMYFP